MPHELMNIQQVARYLHLDEREVRKLASRGKIPCRRRGEDFQFRKSDLDHWVETQMHELPAGRLAQIEAAVHRHHGHAADEKALLVWPMVPPGGVAAPLASKTKSSVLRDLVALADACEMVYGREDLLAEITQREELCSTALLAGTAIPHPRHPVPYDIAESFIVVGRTESGVPFGAPDGSLTRLFFLVCCKDERTHLHVLARLSRLMQDTESQAELMMAEDADAFLAALERAERRAISCPVDR